MTYWQRGARTAGWWAAAVLGLLVVTAISGARHHAGVLDGRAVFFRPDDGRRDVGRAVGLGMATRDAHGAAHVLVARAWLASELPGAFPASRVASTIGVALFVVGPIVFAQMALSYPTGRLLPGPLAWVFVFVLGYAAQAIQNVYNMLFLDLRECPVCPPPRVPTLLHVDASPPISLEDWNHWWLVFVLAILPIGLFLLYRAYARASRAARRSIGPVVLTATFITCTSWISGYAVLTDRFAVLTPISWLQTTGALVAALTALIRVALVWQARGAVGDLVVELDRIEPGGVRDALARAIGDPTLELALWLPDRGVWAEEGGRELTLPRGSDRAVTPVGSGLAAMIHDPVLVDQRPLLEAAGSAARLALENEQLHAELRLQLAELRESRARIVRAGDVERRRLERDLHDGAQQRLLGIGMALRLLRTRVDGNDEAAALVDEAETEAQSRTSRAPRARSRHSPGNTHRPGPRRGCANAGRARTDSGGGERALRAPSSACRDGCVLRRGRGARERREARTCRKGKGHHRARCWVVTVEVEDDGVGGARLDGGSGLRGLVDRVGALDGRLLVDDRPGAGTRLRAEIPCES